MTFSEDEQDPRKKHLTQEELDAYLALLAQQGHVEIGIADAIKLEENNG